MTWFAQNKDPNALFPGTTWKYIGENRTIRLSSANGSDVMTTGGSDTVTLTVGNLPAHGHDFSANTSSFDYGTKTTSNFDYGTKTSNSAGAHTHTAANVLWKGGTGNVVQGGTSNVPGQLGTVTTSSAGAHTHTVAIGSHAHNVVLGDHTHTVGIGAHTHSVSGVTSNTGTGTAFSVTNPFIKLMGWYRSA